MSQQFQDLIQSDRPVLIDFFATWCQPCKVMSSVLNSVKEIVGTEARIVKIDVEQHPSIAQSCSVQGVPCLMLYKNGELLWRASGVHDVETMVNIIRQHG